MVINAKSFLEKAADEIEKEWDVLIQEEIDSGSKHIMIKYDEDIDETVKEEVFRRYRKAGFEIDDGRRSGIYYAKVIPENSQRDE